MLKATAQEPARGTALRSYRDEHSLGQANFASRLGISAAHLCHIEAGRSRPSLDLAFAIERETAGAIPASSWAGDNGEAA